MKKSTLHLLIISTLIWFSVACGGGKNANETTSTTAATQETKTADTAKTEAKTAEVPGKATYGTYCIVCHQADGNGVTGMYPSLVNKDWVGGDKTRLIKIVLNGLSDPITVNGEKYQNVMASHDFLNDKQIADVLSYVRKNFGNDYDPITEAEVAEVRKNNKK